MEHCTGKHKTTTWRSCTEDNRIVHSANSLIVIQEAAMAHYEANKLWCQWPSSLPSFISGASGWTTLGTTSSAWLPSLLLQMQVLWNSRRKYREVLINLEWTHMSWMLVSSKAHQLAVAGLSKFLYYYHWSFKLHRSAWIIKLRFGPLTICQGIILLHFLPKPQNQKIFFQFGKEERDEVQGKPLLLTNCRYQFIAPCFLAAKLQ